MLSIRDKKATNYGSLPSKPSANKITFSNFFLTIFVVIHISKRTEIQDQKLHISFSRIAVPDFLAWIVSGYCRQKVFTKS